MKTSMPQDAEASRPVELQAMLGALIELAGRLGVAGPTTRTAHALARARSATLGLL